MPDDPNDPWQPGQKPSLRDALILLGAAAACSGLFYLWLGDVAAALGYGVLSGLALAAIGTEFFKFSRSYRVENPTSSLSAALKSLVGQSFRIGFFTTFRSILIELFKLLGVKVLVSIVIALTALFIAGRQHLF